MGWRGCATKLWSIERAVIFLTLATFEFVLTLFEFAVLVVSFFYAWFSVLVVGVALIHARKTFLESIPLLIDLAVPVTVFVDSVIVSYDMLEVFCTTVHNAIGHLIGATDVSFTPINVFTADAFTAELKAIAVECSHIDSVAAIAMQWMPGLVDAALCPAFRAIWPIPYGVAPALYAPFAGWVSDPTPYPNGGNCASPPPTKNGLFCAGLAVGFGVIEVVLPSVFVGLLLVSSGAQLFGMLWWAFRLVFAVLDEAACILLTAVRRARGALVCLVDVVEYEI